MNNARLLEAERNLSGIARKVLAAVPVQNWWTSHQIKGEIRRTGAHLDHAVVDGCLGSLLKDGLIKKRGPENFEQFIRVTPKPEPEPKPQPENPPVPEAKPEPQYAKDPLDQLAAMSSSLRQIAGQLSLLATGMDDLALDIEAERQRAKGETTKFRQLQALLRDG